MQKDKIAIAIDKGLLRQIDSLIDGIRLKSRSQAISFFLQKGLKEQSVKKAVILIHKDHQRYLLMEKDGRCFLDLQLLFFSSTGIQEVLLLTQDGPDLQRLKERLDRSRLKTEIILNDTKGTGDSLFSLKNHLEHDNFLVMSGDTFNDFDLTRMIIKHFESERIATMGLINKEKIDRHGVVLLDGALVIDFEEKPKVPKSHIINAGIYIFRPEIFEFLSSETISLEREIFPKLARIKQLHGYFTHGEYIHIPEKG